jgi:hypothetical protein
MVLSLILARTFSVVHFLGKACIFDLGSHHEDDSHAKIGSLDYCGSVVVYGSIVNFFNLLSDGINLLT